MTYDEWYEYLRHCRAKSDYIAHHGIAGDIRMPMEVLRPRVKLDIINISTKKLNGLINIIINRLKWINEHAMNLLDKRGI